MPMAVSISAAAKKAIEKLPAVVKVRVADRVALLADYPAVSGVKALKGERKGEYRVRVGKYRIIFTVAGGVLTVVDVDNRKDVY